MCISVTMKPKTELLCYITELLDESAVWQWYGNLLQILPNPDIDGNIVILNGWPLTSGQISE